MQFDVGDPYCCTIDELERKKQHRSSIAAYLQQEHKNHFDLQSVYQDGPKFNLGPANVTSEDYKSFALDMGMKGCDGLRPPALALPVVQDPLHRARVEFAPKLRVWQGYCIHLFFDNIDQLFNINYIFDSNLFTLRAILSLWMIL
jgi:hypothetical protein